MNKIIITFLLLGSPLIQAATPICTDINSFEHEISAIQEELPSHLIARRVTLEWVFDDRNKYRIEHDFTDNQSRVDCLSMSSPLAQELSENHKFIFPTLIENGQLTVWQMSTLLAAEKLGFWLQPSRLMSNKFSQQVIKDYVMTKAGDRQYKAEKKYQNDDGQFYIKVIFDHQGKKNN